MKFFALVLVALLASASAAPGLKKKLFGALGSGGSGFGKGGGGLGGLGSGLGLLKGGLQEPTTYVAPSFPQVAVVPVAAPQAVHVAQSVVEQPIIEQPCYPQTIVSTVVDTHYQQVGNC